MNASYYEVYVDNDYSSISKEKQYEAFYDNKKIVEKYFTAMRNKGKVLDIGDINTTYFCYDISFNPAFLQAIGAKTVNDVQRQL